MRISSGKAYKNLKELIPNESDEKIHEIMNQDYSYKETDIDLFVKQECRKVLKVALIALVIVTIISIILSIIFSNHQISALFMIASSIIIMTLYITFLIAYIRYVYRD